MEKEKQIKSNLNYFTKWGGTPFVGVGLAIIGLIEFAMPMGHGFIFWILPYVLIVGGIVVYAVGRVNSTSERDFLSDLRAKTGKLKKAEPDEKLLNNHGHTVEVPEEFCFEGFDYQSEGLMFKLLKDDSPVSNRYAITKLVLLQAGLYVIKDEFSLTSDDEKHTENLIDYKTINSVTVERSSVEITVKKGIKTHNLCFVVISCGNGDIKFPIEDDALTDDFVTKFKKKCDSFIK